MKARSLLSSIILLIIPCFVSSVTACTCAYACGASLRAPVIFAGYVSDVRDEMEEMVDDDNQERSVRIGLTARFIVEQAYKGATAKEVIVSTGGGGGDCGYPFKKGERYLIYAEMDSDADELWTSICSGTRLLAGAANEIEWIRARLAGKSEAHIFGVVERRIFNFKAGRRNSSVPVKGAQVIVEGKDRRYETTTDAAGLYRLAGLAPGDYKVRVLFPEPFNDSELREVKIVEKGGCAEEDFFTAVNGRISGKVVDADGQPRALATVAIVPADPSEDDTADQQTLTDSDGSYEFKEVPPGSYLVGVNISRPPDILTAYASTYFPGVAEADHATKISLSEGEKIKGINLVLPPRLSQHEVAGTVSWQDGRPAVGAVVTIVDEEFGRLVGEVNVDLQGRFRIKGFEGRTYLVQAYKDKQAREDDEKLTEPVTITITETVAPISLVVPLPTHELK